MTLRGTPSHSRGMFRPGCVCSFRPKEGVGNAGCPVHPQRRVLREWLECTRVFTASSPENARHPHISKEVPVLQGFFASTGHSTVSRYRQLLQWTHAPSAGHWRTVRSRARGCPPPPARASMPAMPEPRQKITFGEMRAAGVRGGADLLLRPPLQPLDGDQR